MSTPDEGNPPASLGAMADELARLEAGAQALSDREDELREELERVAAEFDATSESAKAARLRLIEAVLDRVGAEPPGTVAWHHGTGPLAAVRAEGRTFLLVAAVCDDTAADLPGTRNQMSRCCSLVVLGDVASSDIGA